MARQGYDDDFDIVDADGWNQYGDCTLKVMWVYKII
jgi:hypothetical protein